MATLGYCNTGNYEKRTLESLGLYRQEQNSPEIQSCRKHINEFKNTLKIDDITKIASFFIMLVGITLLVLGLKNIVPSHFKRTATVLGGILTGLPLIVSMIVHHYYVGPRLTDINDMTNEVLRS